MDAVTINTYSRLYSGVRLALVATALLAAAPGPVPLRAAEAPHDPWLDLRQLMPNEAADGFRKEADKTADAAVKRQAQFGEGVALLDVQPVTDSNMVRATELLTAVRDVNPTDNLGSAARYFLARIAQRHATPPDLAAAEKAYVDLFHDAPEQYWAQVGMVKYAILHLWATNPFNDQAERTRRLAELELILPKLTSPDAIRDFNLALAGAYLIGGDQAEKQPALTHYLNAEKIGVRQVTARGDTLLRIAQLARQLGQNELAIAYYEKFADAFTHDGRNYMVREIVARMKANGGTTAWPEAEDPVKPPTPPASPAPAVAPTNAPAAPTPVPTATKPKAKPAKH